MNPSKMRFLENLDFFWARVLGTGLRDVEIGNDVLRRPILHSTTSNLSAVVAGKEAC